MKNITIFLLILFIFNSCGNTSNNSEIKEATNTAQSLDVIYDLPSLKGKNIDQVVEILGTPEVDNSEPTNQQKQFGVNIWGKSYKRNGYELLINYYVGSRVIIDYFVPTNDPSGGTKNYDDLMQITNTFNNPNVIIEPVKAYVDPSSYTGIKIILL